MASLNRTCKVCGNKYHYCPTCSSDANKPRWMTMFDCEDCKKIFDTATMFNLGKIDKAEAKNRLSGVNTNKQFTETIQHDLDVIMAEPKPMFVAPAIIEEAVEPMPEPEDTQKKAKKYKKPQIEDVEI